MPHADEIYKLIVRHIFQKPSAVDGGSIIDYLFNKQPARDPELDNIGVLDTEGLKKIVEIGKRKFFDKMDSVKIANQSGRRMPDDLYVTYKYDIELIENCMNMMMQSIYATRYNLNRTRPFRKKYKDVGSYHIGVLYGQLMRLRTKMDSLRATMLKLGKWSFIYFLIIYTKMLAAHTDVTFIVRRMFKIHLRFMQVMVVHTPRTPATPSNPNITFPE